MSYFLTSTICIIALMVIYSLVYDNEIIDLNTKKSIYVLTGIVILEILINSISFKLIGLSDELVNFQRCLKFLEYSILPIIPFILARITTKSKMQLKQALCFIIVISINCIIQSFSIFDSNLSVINNNGLQRSTLLALSNIVSTTINLAIFLYIASKVFAQRNLYNNSMLFMTVFLLLGFLIKHFYPDTNVSWLITTFCIYMFVNYITTYFAKIDVLTSLLSQDVFLNSYKKIAYSTAIIMIDVNDFKTINDTYGHKSGDDCLERIAHIILNVYGKYGNCYRVGGDEFCIILKKNMIYRLMEKNANHDCYAAIEELMSSFSAEIKKYAEKDPLLISGVSQGYGVFFMPDECRKESYQDIETVLRYADKRMYEEKEQFKMQKSLAKKNNF